MIIFLTLLSQAANVFVVARVGGVCQPFSHFGVNVRADFDDGSAAQFKRPLIRSAGANAKGDVDGDGGVWLLAEGGGEGPQQPRFFLGGGYGDDIPLMETAV